jgi:hypothetical protein
MQNMGLPPGALDLARQLEEAVAKLREIEAITRRMCADFGLNFSDPSRGLDVRTTPAVTNPVQLKLPSLQDLDIRDAQDGDLLTFDGTRGKWVARRHDTVQLPKEFPQGDPDSYYTEPEPEEPETGGIWSSTTAYTNHIIDPSFETGMTGWFIPEFAYAPGQPLAVTKELTYAPGQGIGGGNAIKIVTTGTVDIMQENYVFFELPSTPRYGQSNVSVRCDTPLDSQHEVYASVINYDADGNYLDEAWVSSAYVGMDQGWQSMFVDIPWQEAFNPPGVRRYLKIRIGSNYNQPWLEDAEIFVDHLSLTENGQYFDGDTADVTEYAYNWTGEPNNSKSIATILQQIQVPETITLGEPFTVNGRGWVPGATVDVYEDDWYAANSIVTVEPDGTFSTTLTIPANTDPDLGPVAGPGVISATREGTNGAYSPFVNVTFV